MRTSSGSPITYLLASLGVALGVVAMAAGNADDSPGLVFLGLLIAVGAVATGVRTAQRRTDS